MHYHKFFSRTAKKHERYTWNVTISARLFTSSTNNFVMILNRLKTTNDPGAFQHQNNCERVRKMIWSNRRLTIRAIFGDTNISWLVHIHLIRWIYHHATYKRLESIEDTSITAQLKTFANDDFPNCFFQRIMIKNA